MTPPSSGDSTQEIAIVPIFDQLTVEKAVALPPRSYPNTIELPIIPPIIA